MRDLPDPARARLPARARADPLRSEPWRDERRDRAGRDLAAVAPIAPRRPVRASERAQRQARRACRDQRVSRGYDRGLCPRSGRRSGLIPSSINPKDIAMLSATLMRALTTPAFVAADFVPTQGDTAEQKANFANALLTFVAQDFPRSKFHESFYRRLSNTFGHIAC